MLSCECGAPVEYAKTGECKRCYHKRYNAAYYAANKARLEAKRVQARRDDRPIDVVLLEKSEQAFLARERHLERRREWNAAHAEQRREYRKKHGDPTKGERNKRAADKRESATGRRAPLTSRRRSPEQQSRKSEYMRRWNDENRERIRAQNAERQREYRSREKGQR